jgi:hypothetical protein
VGGALVPPGDDVARQETGDRRQGAGDGGQETGDRGQDIGDKKIRAAVQNYIPYDGSLWVPGVCLSLVIAAYESLCESFSL